MGIILWIMFGAIAGWIASMIMKTSSGFIWDMIMGIIGSVVGGFLFGLLGKSGVDGFNIYSFFVAVVGACVVIYIGRALRGNHAY
jgi:uncharacterized membrane protein YeaQ/YmgE (transglycosylase-associated protein family)